MMTMMDFQTRVREVSKFVQDAPKKGTAIHALDLVAASGRMAEIVNAAVQEEGDISSDLIACFHENLGDVLLEACRFCCYINGSLEDVVRDVLVREKEKNETFLDDGLVKSDF